MSDIEKTTEKPEDISLKDDIEITVKLPQPKVIHLSSKITASDIEQAWENLRQFNGILKDSPAFSGDPVELQRKIRDE
jgi:hypothetical protein